jgi:hypothetical protein
MEIEDDVALPVGVAGLGQNLLELYSLTALQSGGMECAAGSAADHCNTELTYISSHIPQCLRLIAFVCV